jgi:heme A synthase
MSAEALIGAGLVLLALVAHDASLRRAVGIGLHLLNTFLLLAATSLTAFWASGGGPLALGSRLPSDRAAQLRVGPWLALLLLALLAVGASGALTALGDTLFPSASLSVGMAQDFAPGAHLFVRLRGIHPLLAVMAATAVVIVGSFARLVRPTSAVERASRAATALAVAQVATGLLDLALRAPVALQLIHVVLADALWIAVVLTTAAVLSDAPSEWWARGGARKTWRARFLPRSS